MSFSPEVWQFRDVEISELTSKLRENLDQVPLPPLRERPAFCGLVEVAGITLGAGKSEATKTLGEMLTGMEVRAQLERWQENPFLVSVPLQPFKSETWFLKAKELDNQRAGICSPDTIVLQDVPSEQDWLYAATDFALGRINQEEFIGYQRLYQMLLRRMFRPDLIVFLQCHLEEIFRRVKERGHEFEQNQGERIRALAYLTGR